MNNGNLFNSLLGISGANPAATKASAAKARAESMEKFQQALEQVRPEIAARKPVARKDNPPAEPVARSTPKPAPQRHSPQETNRADAPAKARDVAQEYASKPVEQSEAFVRDTGADDAVLDNQNEEQSAESQQQTLAGETQKTEGEDRSADEVPLSLDNLLVAPAVSGEASVDEVLASPESLLSTANTKPLLADEPANEGDDGLLLGEAVPDPGLLGMQPPVTSAASEITVLPEIAITPELAGDSAGVSSSPLAVSSGQVATGAIITGPDANAQVTAMQAVSGALAGAMSEELAPGGVEAEADLVAGDATATDSGENPDFLLLNSKAALNKLAETTMATATLDKASSAAEVTKPAVVSAAVETLTRLTEAQSPAARAFVVQTGVPVTVGTPQWSQAVGDKVLWLATQNVSSAEIRLDPPELGPMQVKVSVNQDQASVTFTSPHPAVREALDQQLSRLREMFSEQGLNLVNVDVSDKSFAQQEREQKESAKNSGNNVLDEDELAPVAIAQAISMRLVDHYA